jgi:prophage tail gpP-like protein
MNDGDLTLTVNDQSISGWESIRVTRGVERCPSDFDILMSDVTPSDSDSVIVKPGDLCTVQIGDDLVITGYIDKYIPSISPESHNIRITGRGKCQDLVDCAAEWPSGQITESSVLVIAQKLAAYYNIAVSASSAVTVTEAAQAGQIPQTNVIIGETPYELIERFCRFRGYLAYELPDGSLYLSQVNYNTFAASGFVEGQNIQQASMEYSMDQRFSVYQCFTQSVHILGELGADVFPYYESTDPGVLRKRKMKIVMEGSMYGREVCKQRADWENARRAGRGNVLTLTTDSWRDSAGTLWTPNTLVPLDLPRLKQLQVNWVISSVSYKRDENGTTAELVLMPPGAFMPQPFDLLQGDRELQPGMPTQ